VLNVNSLRIEKWNRIAHGKGLEAIHPAVCIMTIKDQCTFAEHSHSSIPLACARCDDSLPFSGASSIPLCCVLFPATLLHQLFVHPLSSHLAIYFLVYLSILFQDSYVILFRELLFSSILCTCPNQRNLFNLTVSSIIGLLTLA
jgi:hypothetical protein